MKGAALELGPQGGQIPWVDTSVTQMGQSIRGQDDSPKATEVERIQIACERVRQQKQAGADPRGPWRQDRGCRPLS